MKSFESTTAFLIVLVICVTIFLGQCMTHMSEGDQLRMKMYPSPSASVK